MRAVAVLSVVLVSCGLDVNSEVAVRREGLTQVTGFGSNPGNLSLHLYEPAGVTTGAALVVALHGCSQTANAYQSVGWNTVADTYGFSVAYPQISANFGCFDWFSSSQQTRTGAQVTSVLQMVNHLVTTRGIDPSRVYISGFSGGGAMANVLLAVAPDVFSRGQVLSGLPFGCGTSCMTAPPNRTPAQWGALVTAENGGRAAPRVQLWHGTIDFTVASGNLQEEVDQWTDVNGIDGTADQTTTLGVATRREFRDASGVTRVESWSLSSTGHGAPIDPSRGCGSTGAYMVDADLCSAEWGARFFGLLDVVDAGVPDAGEVDAGLPEEDAGVEVIDAGVTPTGGGSGGGGNVDVKLPTPGCSSAPVPLVLLLAAVLRRRSPERAATRLARMRRQQA